MRFSFLSRWITPCITFLLLIFCGQQGYLTFKDYKKVTNKFANSDLQPLKTARRQTLHAFYGCRPSGELIGCGKTPAGGGD